MGNYSKLIGALLGNIVAILLAYLATAVPAIASCTVTNEIQSCTVLGIDQLQITAALMAILNTAFVFWFPPNKA